jgi:hypothetical protein
MTIEIASTATIAAGASLSVVASPAPPIRGGQLVGPLPTPSQTPPLFNSPIYYGAPFPALVPGETYAVRISASTCVAAAIPGAVFTTATAPSASARRH